MDNTYKLSDVPFLSLWSSCFTPLLLVEQISSRYYLFLYVKDQKLETSFFSFFSYEVVYNNLNRTSLGWAYLHP
jgi:hypothetical protein